MYQTMTLRQDIPFVFNRSQVFALKPSHTTLVAVNNDKISVVMIAVIHMLVLAYG